MFNMFRCIIKIKYVFNCVTFIIKNAVFAKPTLDLDIQFPFPIFNLRFTGET